MITKAISPLDGRYFSQTRPLAEYFSEEALMKYRLMIEGEYLIALSLSTKTGLKKFSSTEIKKIRSLYEPTAKDFKRIKEIEKITNHDVKAVEYFIKEKLKNTSLKDSLEWIHFGLTSYDINTPARGMMLSDALSEVIIPAINSIIDNLELISKKYKNLPMLARTHGQSASPTTFGKEMKVFAVRLQKQSNILKNMRMSIKFSGATGNWNAHVIAYPKIDWVKFTENFIDDLNKRRKIKLELNVPTTQIDPHDREAEIFDCMRRINTILIDYNQDMWRYISDGWMGQTPKAGEVGSSTMPHKINPIDFENSEGNLGIANSLFEFFARKLPISRLQRDLSDSTVERVFGTAFGHSYLAYGSLLKGLKKISVNKEKILEDLRNHPEVIAEALQTILRREAVEFPYEKLKALTQGREVSKEDFNNFIDSLKVNDKVKKELLKITPENYTGLASKLASKKLK